MQEEKRFAIIIYILAFLVPVAVMTFAFAVYGAYPFGNNTVMTGDTTYQFVDYLSYLKTIIGGDNDFIYSLSKNLGGEMAGFAAYYYYTASACRDICHSGFGTRVVFPEYVLCPRQDIRSEKRAAHLFLCLRTDGIYSRL